MKLQKFRIKNYKSIIDSEECYFSDRMTILAGKNESGKTSILEALQDFDKSKQIRNSAKPIDPDGKTPIISVSFELHSEEVSKILADTKADLVPDKSNIITLIKKFGSSEYQLDEASRDNLSVQYTGEALSKLYRKTVNKIEKLKLNIPFPEKLSDKTYKTYSTDLVEFLQSISTQSVEADIKNSIEGSCNELIECINTFYQREDTVKKIVSNFVELFLPTFTLFSSFDDEFPASIAISDLANNTWAQDLQSISNFNIQKLLSNNCQDRKLHQDLVNIDFADKFKKYWTQDQIKLEVDRDGDNVNFWIKENNKPYLPSQRSKGQQWYLSFYIKIVARISEERSNVILIDEPGLYLHAKAQKDLLNVLREYSPEFPIVFSTHSPYLIEAEYLDSVRLVEKDNNLAGTQILGKVHAHSKASVETLTPILTAIGTGVNDSIINMSQANNVVVEGPSDVFYLQAFSYLASNKVKMNFISGGGSSNMGLVGAILEGWGAKVIYLFDNDSGSKEGRERLKDWHVLADVISEISGTTDESIEDLFSLEDFKKYVLCSENLKYTTSNSKYVKSKDKVLQARKFLTRVKSKDHDVKLDSVSLGKISSLIQKLQTFFSEESVVFSRAAND